MTSSSLMIQTSSITRVHGMWRKESLRNFLKLQRVHLSSVVKSNLIYLSVFVCLPAYLCICPSVCLCLSTYVSIYIYLSVCVFVSTYLSVHLSIRLCIYLFVRPSIVAEKFRLSYTGPSYRLSELRWLQYFCVCFVISV
jgi:hypothetical protein